jgi:hypothetical protein
VNEFKGVVQIDRERERVANFGGEKDNGRASGEGE